MSSRQFQWAKDKNHTTMCIDSPHIFSVTLFYNFAPNNGYIISDPISHGKYCFEGILVFLNAELKIPLTVTLLGTPQALNWEDVNSATYI